LTFGAFSFSFSAKFSLRRGLPINCSRALDCGEDREAAGAIAQIKKAPTLPRHERLLRDQLRLTVNDLNPRLPSELDARGPDLTASHFTSPWTVQELEACFVVKDDAGQKLAYIYFEDEPGRRSSEIAHQRRGAADCGQYREVARIAA
jgi:hypothetical protein